MNHRQHACLAIVVSLAAGCSGVTQLVETDPVRILASTPAPPPPPPPPPPPVVEVTETAIEVHQTINFAFDSDVIESSSFGLMDNIVSVIQEHPEIVRLRIEGHTDNVGTARYNLDLSTRRAASVMRYLTEHGVDAGRLTSEGYGLTRPRATNDTEEGRAENRRVEFNIVERAASAPAATAGGEETGS